MLFEGGLRFREQKKVRWCEGRWIGWVVDNAAVLQEPLHYHGKTSSSVRLCGTDFKHVFLFHRYSGRILQIVFCSMCSRPSSHLRNIRRLWPPLHGLFDFLPDFKVLMAAYSLDHLQGPHVPALWRQWRRQRSNCYYKVVQIWPGPICV